MEDKLPSISCFICSNREATQYHRYTNTLLCDDKLCYSKHKVSRPQVYSKFQMVGHVSFDRNAPAYISPALKIGTGLNNRRAIVAHIDIPGGTLLIDEPPFYSGPLFVKGEGNSVQLDPVVMAMDPRKDFIVNFSTPMGSVRKEAFPKTDVAEFGGVARASQLGVVVNEEVRKRLRVMLTNFHQWAPKTPDPLTGVPTRGFTKFSYASFCNRSYAPTACFTERYSIMGPYMDQIGRGHIISSRDITKGEEITLPCFKLVISTVPRLMEAAVLGYPKEFSDAELAELPALRDIDRKISGKRLEKYEKLPQTGPISKNAYEKSWTLLFTNASQGDVKLESILKFLNNAVDVGLNRHSPAGQYLKQLGYSYLSGKSRKWFGLAPGDWRSLDVMVKLGEFMLQTSVDGQLGSALPAIEGPNGTLEINPVQSAGMGKQIIIITSRQIERMTAPFNSERKLFVNLIQILEKKISTGNLPDDQYHAYSAIQEIKASMETPWDALIQATVNPKKIDEL